MGILESDDGNINGKERRTGGWEKKPGFCLRSSVSCYTEWPAWERWESSRKEKVTIVLPTVVSHLPPGSCNRHCLVSPLPS